MSYPTNAIREYPWTEAFLKRTTKFWQYAIAVLFKNAFTLRAQVILFAEANLAPINLPYRAYKPELRFPIIPVM